MMQKPKLKSALRGSPPYKLNELPKEVIAAVARDILAVRYTKGFDSFAGEEWERSFAKAIGATWTPSNVGLDDVRLGSCCWGTKTVKNTNPFRVPRVRLISGRNSLGYSFDLHNVRGMDPQEAGAYVLGIWNERVADVRARFHHVRTCVLVKGPKLLSGCVFETETVRYDPEVYEWKWNKRNNLEAYDHDGQHKFTWQPHGSQFTIVQEVPEVRKCFRLKPPRDLQPLSVDAILKAIGYDESWIEIY